MRKSYALPLLACAMIGAATVAADARDLLGVAIAGDDRVYYWYGDNGGEVSIGVTDDPFRHQAPQPFEMINSGWVLAAVAINSEDRVYYWWQDNDDPVMLVTVGTSRDPNAYTASNAFEEVSNIYILLEVGIASDDRVYYYWRNTENGRIYNSVGTSVRPLSYRAMTPVEGAIFMQTHLLLHVDIASDDHVYYYWRTDGELVVTSGTSLDPFAYRDVYPANQPD